MQLRFTFNMKGWTIENTEKFKKDFNEYMIKLKDWCYTCEVKKFRKSRSLQQNKFFHWPFLEDLASKLWCDTLTAKKEAKYECLSSSFMWSDWLWKKDIPSTADLTTAEFENFIDRIRDWFRDNYRDELIQPNQTEFNY